MNEIGVRAAAMGVEQQVTKHNVVNQVQNNTLNQQINIDQMQVNMVDQRQVHQQVMHMAAANNERIAEFIRHTGADPQLVFHMIRDEVEGREPGGGGNPAGGPPPPPPGAGAAKVRCQP